MPKRTMVRSFPRIEHHWYKDAVIYELRVRSFYDANGDGVGDFRGLTERLDYLEDLGVTTLWLLPFYPSPMRDDGYDIADYCGVHPECGTLDDFRRFLDEAHRRELRVVTELVLNHTSDQHPWFQRARRAPAGSRERDFYVWSERGDQYLDARVIFQDFEASNWTLDPVAGAYYWHRFYSHQPDLNYDSADVQRAMFEVVDFWLGMGVDGLRLDAVPYLFERPQTNCENLPETHAFLRQLRQHIDERHDGRMLLAEANQWPDDAVAYLGREQCHMAFHFPIMPRLFMSVQMEDRFPITDILAQTPAIDEDSQWALFLRNHDELTLEMVTDEERDYMYRVYARDKRMRVNLGIRRRLAPLLGNNRRNIELLNALLFSLPGTPVVYYGDEIGMGDNIYLGDRDGVRTPMQWSYDRNAGFSRVNPQRLVLPIIVDPEYHYETVNVEAQEQNQHSLLWWMRRMISLRRQHKAFGRGTLEMLQPGNPRVLAFLRQFDGETILIVANLSRFVQYTELDLRALRGMVPRELFGRTDFPVVTDAPYFLSLGPHSFYWFSLEQARGLAAARSITAGPALPAIEATGRKWTAVFEDAAREALERVLAARVEQTGCSAAPLGWSHPVAIEDVLLLANRETALVVLRCQLTGGDHDMALITLGYAEEQRAVELQLRGVAPIAQLRVSTARGLVTSGILFDASSDVELCRDLLPLIDSEGRLRGEHGQARVAHHGRYQAVRGARGVALEPRVIRQEQTNASWSLGDKLYLKLFRRIDEGLDPELEVGRYLTQRDFLHAPPLLAHLQYEPASGEPITLAVVQGFVEHQVDGWHHARVQVEQYIERVLTRRYDEPPLSKGVLGDLGGSEPPELAVELMDQALEDARLIGARIAELHAEFAAADPEDRAFAPEPYSTLYQRSVYQSMRNLVGTTLRDLQRALPRLDEELRKRAAVIVRCENAMMSVFNVFLHRKVSVVRQRCHGDLHLGQLLHTGRDFLIVDFEGERGRPLAERRRKRAALRDVASMVRSFEYVALATLQKQADHGMFGARERLQLLPWVRAWHDWAAGEMVAEYLRVAGEASFVPDDQDELRVLLDAFLVEGALEDLRQAVQRESADLAVAIDRMLECLGDRAAEV